ncbi:MAG: hypothetical protein RMY34_26365 [Aulosira sp. DedQUE10]|nr:hypothetical protein [Aulosira sp. DedQUE10]
MSSKLYQILCVFILATFSKSAFAGSASRKFAQDVVEKSTVRGAEHGGYSKVQKREIYSVIKKFLQKQGVI